MFSSATTIVIAAFDAHSTLPDTLNSIEEAQRRSGYEIRTIVVDDGSQIPLTSTDLKTNTRRWLSLVRLSENQGLWNARNTGTLLVTTPYVTFVDADDLVAEDYFEVLHESLTTQPAAVATRYSDWFPSTMTTRRDSRKFPMGRQQRLLIHSECFMSSFSTVSAQVFWELGGYRPIVTEDWDLWIRFFSKGFTAIQMPKPVYLYRVHSMGLTHTSNLPQRDCETLRQALRESTRPVDRILIRFALLERLLAIRHHKGSCAWHNLIAKAMYVLRVSLIRSVILKLSTS